MQATLYRAEITVRAADKFDKKKRIGRRLLKQQDEQIDERIEATPKSGDTRGNNTVSHPLILLRAQGHHRRDMSPGVSRCVCAMGHTMRLDKIMIWISIHLHSLPRGATRPSLSPPLSTFIFVFAFTFTVTFTFTFTLHSHSCPCSRPRDLRGLFFCHFAFRREDSRYHTNAPFVPTALVSLPSKCGNRWD